MPTVSLIIATYNRGPRIGETLETVYAQSRPADQVIVVDDCSPDGTGDWVRRKFPQVLVMRTPQNLFTSAARNFGATHAKSEVLTFLDHDDLLLPNAIETLLALKEAFPESAAFYADHTYENTFDNRHYPNHHTAQPAFGRLRDIPTIRSTEHGRLYGKGMYRALLWGNLLQQPWAINAEAFRTVGGFAEDVRFCEDWDLYLRLTRKYPIALSDTVISRHLVEGENLHLSPNQATMHERVLQRRFREECCRDVRASLVVRRRLGMYQKMAGDQIRSQCLSSAWKHYAKSLRYWPFDMAVIARTVSWPVRMSLGRS